MIFIIGAIVCAVAFFGWETAKMLRERRGAARRRERMSKGIARQKAWDLVFGRRAQRRLSFDPADRIDD